MSIDFPDANKAWAGQLGLSYPLLSDFQRVMSRAYGALFDDPAMADDPDKIPIYLRSTRSWFVIDKDGIIRYTKTVAPRDLIPNDEILEVLRGL